MPAQTPLAVWAYRWSEDMCVGVTYLNMDMKFHGEFAKAVSQTNVTIFLCARTSMFVWLFAELNKTVPPY